MDLALICVGEGGGTMEYTMYPRDGRGIPITDILVKSPGILKSPLACW